MWIIAGISGAINMSDAVIIYVAEDDVDDGEDKLFRVFADFDDGRQEFLKEFKNEDDAETYVEILVEELNGKMPLGSAFNWLKKFNAKKDVESDVKPVGVDLIDGVPL